MARRFGAMASFLFLILLVCVDGLVVDPDENRALEWQILTKRNFSSQIRLHQHILLMVTEPWSGESRSLMKEIALQAPSGPWKLDILKLMVIYRNTERMLADILDAKEGITVLYYHHSVSYKYQGRLRTQYILSSVYHVMSLKPDELPLQRIKSEEDLKSFFESTDRAVILLEFCGWTSRFFAERNNSGNDTLHVQHLSDTGTNINEESNRTLPPSIKKTQKGKEKEKLTCGVENGPTGIPWFGSFLLENGSDLSLESEDTGPSVFMSCTYEEFQRFDAFFSKFTNIAREYFLPPQRQRFGLVSERSMLSTLGFEDSDSWSVMLNFNGCPNCSKILKEDDDLKTYLRMHHPLVMELDGDGHDLEPALPSNVPSIILFVDRLSASSNIRSKSKEALDAFKELSLHNKFSNQMDGTNIGKPKFSLLQPSQSSRNKRVSYPSVHPRHKYTPKAQMVKLKDKMNVMIINDGGNVALSNRAADARGNSVHEILEYLLQQKKEEKLSSLAKEVGFQLLSDDFAVRVADALQPQLENIPSDQIPSELPVEGTVENSVNLGNDQSPNTGNLSAVTHVGQSGRNVEHTGQNDNEEIMYHEENTKTEPGHVIITDELGTADVMDKEQLLNTTSTSAVKHEEQTRCNDVESSFQYGKQEIICSEKTNTIEQSQMIMNDELGMDGNTKVEGKSSMEVDKLLEQQVHYQGFTGPFFFSDGGYQLLRSLTTGSKIPSVVIVDPISQKHYIYGKKEVSYSSLLEFLDGFLNGTLISYQRSESILFSSREAVRPPFVNVDFHEVKSIPRVTVNTFSELVLGVNQSETQNFGLAWKKDVFVLFSNSWCGFCQRMELVVREVYRAFKGYMNMSKSESWHTGSVFMNDNLGNVILNELPPIFLMDCTLNDCSSILNRLDQREFYPALILFPSERKIPISYEGDMTVTNVMKFIANRGSKSHHHGERSGILLLESEKGGRKQTSSENASPIAVQEEASFVNAKYHEALLNNRAPTAAVIDYKIKSWTSNELHESSANVVVGTILTATDKLLNAFPFDKSTILIVKADQVTGFQGLIINKRIKWEALREFEDGLEFIKQSPLSFGGPVIAHGTPLTSLVRRLVREEYPEVLPGVNFVDQISTIQEIEHLKSGNRSTIDYWFFLGYSSWLWDQLFDEIAEGAWLVSEEIGNNLSWPRS